MVHAPFYRFSTPLIIVTAAILLSGCHKTLVYGEQTGFNLAIQVNDDPKTPVQVNAGLKRTVGQLTPPTSLETDANGNSTNNDAVSTFSGFRLNYDEEENVLMGKLTIKTQFATGTAASALSDNPEAVAAFLSTDYDRSSDHVSDENIERVDAIAETILNNLDDQKAMLLACNPPGEAMQMKDQADMDPSCTRVVDPGAARQFLLHLATMSARSGEQLTAWETALGIR